MPGTSAATKSIIKRIMVEARGVLLLPISTSGVKLKGECLCVCACVCAFACLHVCLYVCVWLCGCICLCMCVCVSV